MVASGKEAFVLQILDERCLLGEEETKLVVRIGFRIQIYTTYILWNSQLENEQNIGLGLLIPGIIGKRKSKSALEEGKSQVFIVQFLCELYLRVIIRTQ